MNDFHRRLIRLLPALWLSLLAACGGGSDSEDPPETTPTYALQVLRFGEGSVASTDRSIDCGSTCTVNYDTVKSVTLKPTAATNWTFHHWSGCDSVAADLSCTVSVAENRVVYPVFSSNAAPLKTGVKTLSSATMARLDSVAGSTYVFSAGTTEAAALQVGDVFVSLEGQGHARRVQSVLAPSSSPILVSTTDAALDEVLAPGTLVYNSPLTQSQLASATALRQGVKLRAATGTDSRSFNVDLDSAVNGLQVTGTLTLEFTPDFAVHVSSTGLEQFRSALQTTATANLSMDASASASGSVTTPLMTFQFNPIVVAPVVLVPKVTVSLTLSGNSEAAFTTSVTFTESVQLGVDYRRDSGWSTVRSESHQLSHVAPTLSGALSAKANIGSTGQVAIYGIAGPYSKLDTYARAEAAASVTATQGCLDWSLYAGLDGSAGINGKIVSWTIPSYNVRIFSKQWRIASGQTTSCNDTQAPTVPSGVSVTALSPNQLQVSWSASSDNVRVAGYRILSGDQPLAEVGDTLFVDTALTPDTRYCYRVVAIDLAGNTSAPSAEACGRTLALQDVESPTAPGNLTATPFSTNSIDLTWTASRDNVGVAGYVVLRNGTSVLNLGGDVLSARDTGLRSNTRYCYQVVAFDQAGNTSAASAETCTSTASAGAWDVYVKCEGRPYQIKFNLDVDPSASGTVQTEGTGTDYPGTPLTYVLNGTVNPATQTLNGQITWTNQGNSCIRRDTFSAALTGDDSTDLTTNQVARCGCDINVRFRKAGMDPLFATGDRSLTQSYGLFSARR